MSLSFHSLLIKDDNFDKTDYDIRIFDVTSVKQGYVDDLDSRLKALLETSMPVVGTSKKLRSCLW